MSGIDHPVHRILAYRAAKTIPSVVTSMLSVAQIPFLAQDMQQDAPRGLETLLADLPDEPPWEGPRAVARGDRGMGGFVVGIMKERSVVFGAKCG